MIVRRINRDLTSLASVQGPAICPRYTVGSVTGWAISATGTNGRRRRDKPPPTFWYMHDRLVGYRIVEEFIGIGGQGSVTARDPELRARRRCNELNTEYESWLRRQGVEVAESK